MTPTTLVATSQTRPRPQAALGALDPPRAAAVQEHLDRHPQLTLSTALPMEPGDNRPDAGVFVHLDNPRDVHTWASTLGCQVHQDHDRVWLEAELGAYTLRLSAQDPGFWPSANTPVAADLAMFPERHRSIPFARLDDGDTLVALLDASDDPKDNRAALAAVSALLRAEGLRLRSSEPGTETALTTDWVTLRAGATHGSWSLLRDRSTNPRATRVMIVDRTRCTAERLATPSRCPHCPDSPLSRSTVEGALPGRFAVGEVACCSACQGVWVPLPRPGTDPDAWAELPDEDGASCVMCGCTDDEACEGGCFWVPDNELNQDLCSACHDQLPPRAWIRLAALGYADTEPAQPNRDAWLIAAAFADLDLQEAAAAWDNNVTAAR